MVQIRGGKATGYVNDRPIVGEFNEERIVARPWPAKEGQYTILELTG